MVVERKDLWFMDAGGLTYNFCEDNSPMENAPTVEPCCACDEAKYEVEICTLYNVQCTLYSGCK